MVYDNYEELYYSTPEEAIDSQMYWVFEWRISDAGDMETIIDWRLYYRGNDYSYDAFYYDYLQLRVTDESGNANFSKSRLINVNLNNSYMVIKEGEELTGTFSVYHNDNDAVELKFTLDIGGIPELNYDGYYWQTDIGEYYGNVPALEPNLYAVVLKNTVTDEESITLYYGCTNDLAHENVFLIQACLMDEDGYELTAWKQLLKPTDDDEELNYIFEFDEYDYEIMYNATADKSKTKAYIVIEWHSEDGENYGIANSNTFELKIINAEPILSPTIKDVNPVTLALTGDENTLVKYYSNAYFEINAEPQKGASIIKQRAQTSTEDDIPAIVAPTGTFIGLPQGWLDFYAEDSRGNLQHTRVENKMIEYFKPTCNQSITIQLTAESVVEADVTVTGNWFNSSFGVANNELNIEIRHSQLDGTMGDWVRVTDGLPPTIDGNKYTLHFSIDGFDNKAAYDFQCRVIDCLSTTETTLYTARLIPVFDWGEYDFNVNVPVTMQDGLTVTGSVTATEATVENGLTVSGVRLLLPYILSDTSTSGTVELNDNIYNYEYIEVFYEDNNGRGGGYTKFVPPTEADTSITLSLSLVDASGKNATYIRRCSYICKNNTLNPSEAYAGYVLINSSGVTHSADAVNYITVTRVIGYK